MTTSQKVIGAIAILGVLLGLWALARPAQVEQIATTFGNVAGGTISPTGVVLPNPSVFDFLESRVALLADSQFMLGGATATTGLDQVPSIGSCAVATSTAFSVLNPYAATSTAIVWFYGGAQATSSQLIVGTSTASTGLTSSSVSATLINASTPTTTTPFLIRSGLTTGAMISAGAGTAGTVVVGPTQRVSGFSTSTYSNAGAVNYTNTTCTYKIRWEL